MSNQNLGEYCRLRTKNPELGLGDSLNPIQVIFKMKKEMKCPICGSEDLTSKEYKKECITYYYCNKCNTDWTEPNGGAIII